MRTLTAVPSDPDRGLLVDTSVAARASRRRTPGRGVVAGSPPVLGWAGRQLPQHARDDVHAGLAAPQEHELMVDLLLRQQPAKAA